MKDLLEKVSSYNLFNSLLPGVIFITLINKYTHYFIYEKNVFALFFIYYFIGLVINRIGSLALDPIIKKTQIIKFAPYKNYCSAVKKDQKIELFSEINNSYRTLSAVFITFIILKIYESIEKWLSISESLSFYILITSLAILFILSYKKQTEYITKRIELST